MKKQLLSLIVLVVVLCLTACTANQNQVSKPTSPEIWGTAFLGKRFLKLFWKILNFSIRKPSIILTFMGILLWLGHIGMIIWVTNCIRVAFLQAVPANTSKIELPSGDIPVSDWEQYQIFKDQDVIIYDLYPMLYPEGTVPERVAQEVECSYYQTQEEYQAGKIPEDRYFHEPLNSRLTQTRYLNYLWDYYQNNLPDLITKIPNKE